VLANVDLRVGVDARVGVASIRQRLLDRVFALVEFLFVKPCSARERRSRGHDGCPVYILGQSFDSNDPDISVDGGSPLVDQDVDDDVLAADLANVRDAGMGVEEPLRPIEPLEASHVALKHGFVVNRVVVSNALKEVKEFGRRLSRELGFDVARADLTRVQNRHRIDGRPTGRDPAACEGYPKEQQERSAACSMRATSSQQA